jgi:integrase
MGYSFLDGHSRPAWNAGRKVGAKRALRQKEVWAVRFWLDRERRIRDRALFDLAVDSKLRGCDLVRVRIGDLVNGAEIRSRSMIIQRKTGRPVQFEILEPAKSSLLIWLNKRGGAVENYAFPSRLNPEGHLSTR